MTFAEHYGNLVAKIMSEESEYDFNQRTRSGLNFLPEGYSFAIDLHDNILPTCGLRRTRPHIAAAEVAWCFSGSPSILWLNKHTSIWKKFAGNDDNIKEAYGYRWKYAFGYDQIKVAIERLIADPSDRRIYISSWDPSCDLLPTDQKTVPCPVGFTLSISRIEGRASYLNSSLLIRSSDVFIGLPLDVMRHALVMRAIASSISRDWNEMQLGHMRVTLAHPHLYENQWDMALEMLDQDARIPNINMSDWNVDQIVTAPDDYVAWMRQECIQSMPWPEYDPKVMVMK